MAYMDGSQRRTIVNSSMSDQPNHLFLDYANNRLVVPKKGEPSFSYGIAPGSDVTLWFNIVICTF